MDFTVYIGRNRGLLKSRYINIDWVIDISTLLFQLSSNANGPRCEKEAMVRYVGSSLIAPVRRLVALATIGTWQSHEYGVNTTLPLLIVLFRKTNLAKLRGEIPVSASWQNCLVAKCPESRPAGWLLGIAIKDWRRD